METGQTLQLDFARVVNANVYLGTAPIVEALKNGADIVITGRVADPCLYLAPMIAYYGWDWDAWDKLASGIVAGHLLECTAQVVGGNSLAVMDDITPEDLPDLGYPIAHIDEDGSFILTKTPDSPGIVNVNTVKEQLLYEVHDPANYITPDVIADFTTLRLAEVGKDQMRVTNVTGKPRPDKLKLHISQHEGYMRELIFTLSYPEAWRKVDQLKRMIASSWQNLAIDRVEYSYLGQNSLFGSLTALPDDPLEVIVRVMFTAQDDGILQTGVRRLMQNGLSGPAGMSVSGTTISGKPRAILGLSPTLIDRELVNPQIKYIEV